MSIDILRDTLRVKQARDGVMSREELAERAFKIGAGLELDEAEIMLVIRELEAANQVSMRLGATLLTSSWKPWLQEKKPQIDWYFWRRYTGYLLGQGFPVTVLSAMDDITERIVGLLEDPTKPGAWHRKGLVLGHVQSGKTANYTGLINKAADAGYKVIIVIAGIHENLRIQTQGRIDAGFTGHDSASVEKVGGKPVGVGNIDSSQRPFSFTSTDSDFRKNSARAVGGRIAHINVPVVFVIKKNKSTLQHLIDWLKGHNAGPDGAIHDIPMLLIDDEADNASVNTASDPDKATAINGQIRQILGLFKQSCYVGYTATPFANIFIDKSTDSEKFGTDLFPEDFIVSLDPPSNYMGASTYFSEEEYEERRHLREILDTRDVLPLVHSKEFEPERLPESLLEAIRAFLLVLAIRHLRGQGKKHSSMLVNVSRFVDVQNRIGNLLRAELWRYQRAVAHYHALNPREALAHSSMNELYQTWLREFSRTEFSWDDVQRSLHEATASVRVAIINGQSKDNLDYKQHEATGLKVIANGGMSLSRGLTLEGLCISYFHRNSAMYDTLLQMARWFGYRPGYEDLCRVWMPPEGIGWYVHIAEATEELRAEVRRMERLGRTPADFGLKVRNHPDALIVTARNKMRSAQRVVHSVSYENQLFETHKVDGSKDALRDNLDLFKSFVGRISAWRVAEPTAAWFKDSDYFFSCVPVSHIEAFINRFKFHDYFEPQKEPLLEYIGKGSTAELALWDVLLVSVRTTEERTTKLTPDFVVGRQERKLAPPRDGRPAELPYTISTRQRISSRGIEKAGLDEEQLARAEKEDYKGNNVPDWAYRRHRPRPLLMLHILDLVDQNRTLVAPEVAAWGVSFPPTTRSHPEVEYVVNKTWIERNFGTPDEDDDDQE